MEFYKEICGICGEHLDGEPCTCNKEKSVTFFSYQRDFSLDDEGIVICECGSFNWKMVTHINGGTKHNYLFTCGSCGATLGREVIYTNEDLMY